MGQEAKLRILHVDDVPMNLQVMDHLLAMLGHEPVAAASGAEAFDLMERMAFDVVLTDFHMPDVTGLDFLRNVRAMREPARSTPVVVVTADVMSWSSAALRQLGFAGALAKPVSVDAARRVLAAVLANGQEFVGEGFSRAQA